MTVVHITEHDDLELNWFNDCLLEETILPPECLSFLVKCNGECDCENPLGHAG